MEIIDTVNALLHNLSDDQRRLLLSILITFPIGFLNHFIKGRMFRLLYGLVFGFIVQFYMYQYSSLHILFSSIVCLLITHFCERSRIGWITTIYAFTHLSSVHIYRMVVDYGGWSMDVSTILMMTVCKFTSFAHCYSDGAKDDSKLTKFTLKTSIKHFSPIEYFSYIYFYPTCIMGPFFEFSDFKDFINQDGDYKSIPVFQALFTGIKRLLGGFIVAAVYLSLKPYISVHYYLNTDTDRHYFRFIIFLCFLFQKYKYYTGFFFAESVCVVSGVAYRKSEDQGKDEFDKIISFNIMKTETSMHLSKFFQNWNISIHNWLKKYIHFRIYDDAADYKDRTKLVKAKVITYMISGLWHGFYPSYYIIFSQFAFAVILEENFEYIKKNISKSQSFNKLLDAVYFLVVLSNACYLIGILDSLHFPTMLKFMSSVYFAPTIFGLSVLLWTKYYIKMYKSEKLKEN